MKFRIHFEIHNNTDFFEVEGDTIEEIREKADSFFTQRGLTAEETNAWSEEL